MTKRQLAYWVRRITRTFTMRNKRERGRVQRALTKRIIEKFHFRESMHIVITAISK